MAEQRKVRRFHAKFADSAALRKGGRKVDSQYYRRQFRGKKIAFIHGLAPNTELIIITASFHMPELKPGLIDRFLVLAQQAKVRPLVLLTKTDLLQDPKAAGPVAEVWRAVGYEVLLASCVTGEGVAELRALLKGRVSVIVGHSGVGKTSLLRAVDAKYLAAVAEVSAFTKRGRHTTTIIRSHDFPFGGSVYDMPGLKEVDFINLQRPELAGFYPEFARFQEGCHFKNCTHTHETDCAVKLAEERKEIHPVRYANYLQIFDSLPV